MFGGKNKEKAEQLQRVREVYEKNEQLLYQVSNNKENVNTCRSELDTSKEQMIKDIHQVQEHNTKISDYMKENLSHTSEMNKRIEQWLEEIKADNQEWNRLKTHIELQTEECIRLADENKHFTSPSKYLNDFPGYMRGINKQYESTLDEMSTCAKQMGVVALNTAIEAGRMGESGKQYVNATEEIRLLASNYENIARDMKNQVKAQEEKISELEEQIRLLIGLLKENNVSTIKLMKLNTQTDEMAKESNFITDKSVIEELKKEITGIYNMEEEVLKLDERNRLQMEDILTEANTQAEKEKEIQLQLDNISLMVDELKEII